MSSSASQETLRILRNQKVPYHVDKDTPILLILTQINPLLSHAISLRPTQYHRPVDAEVFHVTYFLRVSSTNPPYAFLPPSMKNGTSSSRDTH